MAILIEDLLVLLLRDIHSRQGNQAKDLTTAKTVYRNVPGSLWSRHSLLQD